ncbi:MAG: glycosyltransferase [Planctomycetota bacterium]
MREIALIDPYRRGHHEIYMKTFARALLELGHRVIAFAPEPEALTSWVEARCPEAAMRMEAVRLLPPSPSRLPMKRVQDSLNMLAHWRTAGAALSQIEAEAGRAPDLAFFCWLDAYASYSLRPLHARVARLFHYPWSGLYFHPRFLRIQAAERRRLFPRRWELPFSSPLCRSVALLDEGVSDAFARGTGKKVVVFPDFADDSPPDRAYAPARAVLERARGRKVIGLVGSLARRKGVFTLLEAARRAEGEDRFFVIAGEPAATGFRPEELSRLAALAAAPPSNALLLLGRIPGEAQFNALIEACDLVFAAYEDFPHSSNILAKAALFEKPVIVSRGYCMEERLRRFGLGLSIPEGDVEACKNAIRKLLPPGGGRADGLAPDYAGYLNEHSLPALREAFHRLLAEAAPGTGPGEGARLE